MEEKDYRKGVHDLETSLHIEFADLLDELTIQHPSLTQRLHKVMRKVRDITKEESLKLRRLKTKSVKHE